MVVGQVLSTLGKGMGPALIAKAKEMGVKLPAQLDDPKAKLTPDLVLPFLRDIVSHFFPLLAGTHRTTAESRGGDPVSSSEEAIRARAVVILERGSAVEGSSFDLGRSGVLTRRVGLRG